MTTDQARRLHKLERLAQLGRLSRHGEQALRALRALSCEGEDEDAAAQTQASEQIIGVWRR